MESRNFTIARRDVGAKAVAIALSGRVYMGAESEEIETLTASLLREGKRTIVFDLSGVTRLDSTGIGRFISSYNQIASAGGEMRMAGASPRLLHVFHVSRLDTIFAFYPTVQEAAA